MGIQEWEFTCHVFDLKMNESCKQSITIELSFSLQKVD